MIHIQAPADYHGPLPSIFLAGGISGCELWQPRMVEMLASLEVALLNPRRDNYPWHDPAAAEAQIRWEFEHLARVTAGLFWFPPQTLCPIALYELGRWSAGHRPMFVGVHPDYQRRLDVEIQLRLARPEVQIANSLDALAKQVIERMRNAECGIRSSLRDIPNSALILVDLQNDFLPGGALAVPRGDEVIPVANRLASHFDLIVATQDWHPADHGSFAANHPGKRPGEQIKLAGLDQILWPTHCVQASAGADFAAQLDRAKVRHVVHKGTDPTLDSYSGFFDNAHRKATGLEDYLRQHGVTDVYVLGLATDYCVKYTALDAQQLGFRTFVVADGCRGVDLQPGDSQRALEELARSGVQIIDSSEIAATAKMAH